MHNACIKSEAGAGRDILPRHRAITIAPTKMLPGVVHTLPTSLRSAGNSGPERDVGMDGNRTVTQMLWTLTSENQSCLFLDDVSARKTCPYFPHLQDGPIPLRRGAQGEGPTRIGSYPTPPRREARGGVWFPGVLFCVFFFQLCNFWVFVCGFIFGARLFPCYFVFLFSHFAVFVLCCLTGFHCIMLLCRCYFWGAIASLFFWFLRPPVCRFRVLLSERHKWRQTSIICECLVWENFWQPWWTSWQ